jgi:peptide/nickel transport system permease protein
VRLARLRATAVAIAASGAVLGVLAAVAVLAPWLAPRDPIQNDLARSLQEPFQAGAPLGTDHLGRDILTRLLYGARVSLVVAVVAVGISGLLGVLLGLVSGFYGGLLDSTIMAVADVQLSFPFLLLVVSVVAILGPGLVNVVLVLGLTGWVAYARIVRSTVLSLRSAEFVLAVRAAGARDRRVLLRHILPNVLSPILVVATFSVAQMIVWEAGLSFLGLGVQPPTPTWGGMLSDGRQYLATAWWIATFPGLAIMLVVLCLNLVGDWLRDAFDPTLDVARP